MSHSETTHDSSTELKTIDDLRFKQAKATGCVSVNFTRNIEHLQSGSPTERVCDEVGRLLYEWLQQVSDVDSMQFDGKTMINGKECIHVEETVELHDSDEETITEAVELARSTEQAMREAVTDRTT
jgi:hypothetical protein